MTESRASRLAPGASWSQVQAVTKGGEQRGSERGSRVRTEERGSDASETVGGAAGSTGSVAGAAQDAKATRGSQRGRIMAGRIAEAGVFGEGGQ